MASIELKENINASGNRPESGIISAKKSLVENEDQIMNHRCQLEHGIYFQRKLREGKHAACKLGAVAAICLVFCVIEAVGGIVSGSLSILTDAAHQLSDVTGFVISLFAVLISQKKATFHNSYGYHRADVLGAILSIFVIWALLIWLIIEAIDRVINPTEIDGVIMLVTSIIGLLCNLAAFFILIWCGVEENEHGEKENIIASVLSSYKASGVRGNDAPLLTGSQRMKMSEHSKSSQHSKNSGSKGAQNGDHEMGEIKTENIDKEALLDKDNNQDESKHSSASSQIKKGDEQNLNIRAAIIHLLGDIVQSIGVIIAAIIIYIWPQATIADPITTFVFSILVLLTTVPVFKDCINILMENSPDEIDSVRVYNTIARLDCVEEIHDWHMWSLSAGKTILTAHIRTKEKNPYSTLHKISTMLEKKLGIHHATIQIEPSNPQASELKCENIELEN